jgi:hypothetical protein
LANYRDLVSEAWGPATIHRRFTEQAAQGGPASLGQCGVTSAWLIVVLAEVHGVRANYCYGDVLSFPDPARSLRDHCWLEVAESGDSGRTIIDLTCDQSQTFSGVSVLCSSFGAICDEYGVAYTPKARLTIDELDKDEVQPRLRNLVKAVGVDRLPVIPERWAKLVQDGRRQARLPCSGSGQSPEQESCVYDERTADGPDPLA